jgi:hypothetical protein
MYVISKGDSMDEQQIEVEMTDAEIEDKLDDNLYRAEEALRDHYEHQEKSKLADEGIKMDVANIHEFLELSKAKRRKRVKIEAWDRYVWIRELTLGEQMEIEEKCTFIRGETEKGSHVMFEMMKRSLQNAKGDPLIAPDAEYDDIKNHSIGFLQAGNAVVQFNSATAQVQEDLKKN